MAATFSGKQNQGWDIRSLMHCLRWLVPHLEGVRGSRFQDLVQSFLCNLHDKQIIIYSSKCLSHFTLCWMLFAARFNSICFINFRRASKKRCEKKGFNGKRMHPSLEKSFSFPRKSAVSKKKELHRCTFPGHKRLQEGLKLKPLGRAVVHLSFLKNLISDLLSGAEI